MTTKASTLSPKLQLFARHAQALELDRLAELLGEMHDETGEIDPCALAYYIGNRREQIAAHIAHLRAAAA